MKIDLADLMGGRDDEALRAAALATVTGRG
jgi:hypothetical protein